MSGISGRIEVFDSEEDTHNIKQVVDRVVLSSILNATSMKNQFGLIKTVLERSGYKVVVRNTISPFEVRNIDVEGVVVATLFDPNFLTANAPAIIQYKGNKLVYVTIEGLPKKGSVLYSPLPRLKYYTVSKFVGKLLSKTGLSVKASVHHCIDIEETIRAVNMGNTIRQKLIDKFGDKVKLLFVARNDPRKGIDKLIHANQILRNSGIDNYVIFVISEPSIKDLINDDRFVFVSPFGSLKHEQILATMHAVDYVLFPSKSEGFGLPVLESMSVGTPVIHTWMPPLTEFSSDEFNFVYDFENIQIVNTKMSQYYIMHEYNAEILADTIKDAIDTYNQDREAYIEYRVKAMEHALSWDYRLLYTRLLDMCGFDIDVNKYEEELNSIVEGIEVSELARHKRPI